MKFKMKARYTAALSQTEMETLSIILNFADAYVMGSRDNDKYERLIEDLLGMLDQLDDGQAQILHDVAFALANTLYVSAREW